MKANKLKDVYKNFDPVVPLSSNSEFYVERKDSPLDEIKEYLLRENQSELKILFSGHRGSGKSTELNQLMADDDIQIRYFITHYSVREVLDLASLDYVDLLFSIGAEIYSKANDLGLIYDNELLKKLESFCNIIDKETEKGFNIGVEAGISTNHVDSLARILPKLRFEYTNRRKIRKRLQSRMPEMIGIINEIIGEVKSKSGNDILVAIDDLDKPDLKTAEQLFYHRQTSLTQIKCNIIYTIPIALCYSQNYNQVKQAFTDSFILPNVSINHKDHSANESGRRLMEELVEKRMSLDLIDMEALKHAIEMSGGVFRQMVHIINKSAAKAKSRDDNKIRKTDVETAENEIRDEFRRILRVGDYSKLRKIHKDCRIYDSGTCARLMHNLSVLEYKNDGRWCDVHPAVIPLLTEK